MNNPFSLSGLSRHKSAEMQLFKHPSVEIKAEQSEKMLALLNPFTLPSVDTELYHQREIERIEEGKYRQAIKYYPIQERHTFTQPKSVLNEIKKEVTDNDIVLPAVGSRRALSSKKETIKEFIQRKREILLVKKNIENKKSKYNELEEDLIRKEEKHKANIKKLDDNKGRVAKYEEQLKLEVDYKAKLAEDKAVERNERQKELKNLLDEIDSLKAKVDRKIDELKALEDYKEFVEELVPNDNKSGVFVTETFTSFKFFAKRLEEGINSLETTNLFQIQQAQEDEQELEMLRHKNHQSKIQEMKKCSVMKNTVHLLEAQKKQLEEKLKKISTAEEIEAPADESNSKRVHNELVLLFIDCGGDMTNNPKELEMLEFIEKVFDNSLKIKETKNPNSLITLEKEIERERRRKNIEDQNNKNVKKNEEIARKIEQRKQKVVKKDGRKDMKRSKLHEKVEVEQLPDESESVLDRREFLETEN